MVHQPLTDVEIGGKKVTVRTSFRGKQWWSLPADYRAAGKAIQSGDYSGVIPFLARVIESWDFEGSPAEPASYEQLDVLSELMPLAGEVIRVVWEAAFPESELGT